MLGKIKPFSRGTGTGRKDDRCVNRIWGVLLCDVTPSSTSFKHLQQTLGYLHSDLELDVRLCAGMTICQVCPQEGYKREAWRGHMADTGLVYPTSTLSVMTGPGFCSEQQMCSVQNISHPRFCCTWLRSQDSVRPVRNNLTSVGLSFWKLLLS